MTVRERLSTFLGDSRTEWGITGLILLNAVTLGLETSATAMAMAGPLLLATDRLILTAFVIELLMRVFVHRLQFFRDPWRVFDFAIVSIALMPATGAFSVLRALRVLRVLRLLSFIPTLRKVVGGLIAALPGMASIIVLLGLVFYVFSVMATKLFGAAFPDWFGSIGASAYSLFQIMTLESWSMGIVRPVMAEFPYAWAFFVPFIICTTFTVLNLFIGIIVSAMQADYEQVAEADRAALHEEQETILVELKAMREEIRLLRADKVPAHR